MIFTCRPAAPEDRMFIVSGCSASLRLTRDLPLISMADYADIMHSQIGKMLERAGVQTIVAEGSVLAGFITFERNAHVIDGVMHRRPSVTIADYVFYVYVAKPFRRRQIARGLFEAAGIVPSSRFYYACRTLSSWELRDKIPLAHYSPFYARYSPEENQNYERSIREDAARRKTRRG